MEIVESIVDKIKDIVVVVVDKSKGVYEVLKEKVGEGVDSVLGVSEDVVKVGLKIISDGVEKV